MRSVLTCLTALILVAHAAGHADGPASASASATAASAALVDRFLAVDTALVSYRALRTLEASTRGGRMRGRLTAWTSQTPEQGFQFSIVSEEGSGLILDKVLRSALVAERDLHSSASRGAFTSANYGFLPLGRADGGLERIELLPKREDTMLVAGTMLVTSDTADLVEVQGRLVKRPSFWTRRVDVTRRYTRIAGARVPVSMSSTAHVLIVGASTFSMVYEYTSINGQAVTRTGDGLSALSLEALTASAPH